MQATIEAYEACSPEQRVEVLSLCILPSDGPPSAMLGNDVQSASELVLHLLSKLAPEADAEYDEATVGRVLAHLVGGMSDDDKLKLLGGVLKNHGDPKSMGVLLADMLVGKMPRHIDVIDALAEALGASPDPNYKPPHDEPKLVLKFQVLQDLRSGLSAEGVQGKAGSGGSPYGDEGGTRFFPLMGAGGVMLDANGNPILGADGRPLVANVTEGAWGEGFEAAANEMAENEKRLAELKRRQANGELSAEELAELARLEARQAELAGVLAGDPRIPAGGSIGPGGVILDANGNPVLGADGKPLMAGAGLGGMDPDDAQVCHLH